MAETSEKIPTDLFGVTGRRLRQLCAAGRATKTITLDGRTFDATAQARACDQIAYIEYQLWCAGVVEIPNDLRPVTREEKRSADEVVTEILLSGRNCYLIAGCLNEQGKLWDRNEADRNASRFAAITDAREKAAMQEFVAGFIASLFTEER